MTRVRVKICGITRMEDAQIAVLHGVDALGFVFCDASPRNVSAEQAKHIIDRLPAFVTPVALFMDPQKQQVDKVLQQIPNVVLQFHGQETEAFCRQFGKPYIKSVAMGSKVDLEDYARRYASSQALLLDSNKVGKMGGSGKTFDWSRQIKTGSKPYILAGGLSPENVCAAIETAKPYAVDVSSGVEKSKGIKDHERIRQLLQKVIRIVDENRD